MTSKEAEINRPNILICADAIAASKTVAGIIAAQVRTSPECVLGLSTGGTPIETYRELIRMHREEGLDFSGVSTFNLDEYVGLAPDHPQSYRFYMQEHLFDHINIDPARTHIPDGLADNVDAHVRQYEQQITALGGIDLQLLGIGENGHIAFNEPGSAADSRTRSVALAEETIQVNSRYFESIDEVPRQAITMGIGTILEAKQIVLMVTGEAKAAAFKRAIEGDPDPSSPASLLQTHPDVLCVIDLEAAKPLSQQTTAISDYQ